MNKFLGLAVLLVPCHLAYAEEVPPAPIVTTPAAHMKWSMSKDTESNSPASASAPMVKAPPSNPADAVKWEYKKGGKFTQIMVTYAQGATREYWRTGTLTLCENPHLRSVDIRGDGFFAPYPKACDGFYGIGQVHATDDQGKKDFKGVPSHYFRGLAPSSTSAPAWPPEKRVQPAAISYEAWFDLKTGLPKAFRQNGETLLFEFSSEVPGDLQLPPIFQKAWDLAAGRK